MYGAAAASLTRFQVWRIEIVSPVHADDIKVTTILITNLPSGKSRLLWEPVNNGNAEKFHQASQDMKL